MDYVYVVVDNEGADSWEPRRVDIGYYWTEQAARDAVPEEYRDREHRFTDVDDEETRTTLYYYDRYSVDRIRPL